MNRYTRDAYYRFIFENSIDAIMLTRPDGCICRANHAAEIMFQRSETEICEIARNGLVDLNDPRLYEALHERERCGFARAEINFIRKDGTIFPGDVTSAVFSDEQGESLSAMIIRDVSKYKEIEQALLQANEEAEFFAKHDFLTGILNRRIFLEKLMVEHQRSAREKHSYGLFMIDIDHFKYINDTFGHFAGDDVLKSITSALQSALRPYDLFGRYGGDEFIICLPSTKSEEATEVAERLRLTIEQLATSYNDDVISTTISIGVTEHKWSSDEVINDIIVRADNNLFKAKKIKNCVVNDE